MTGTGSATVDSRWYRAWDVGGSNDTGDIWGGVKGDVSVTVSGSSSVSATYKVDFAWWIGRYFDDPHPDDVDDSRLDAQRVSFGPATVSSDGAISFVKSVINGVGHEEANWGFHLWP